MGEGEAERGVWKVLKPRNLKKWGGGGGVSKRSKSYFQIILSVVGIIFNIKTIFLVCTGEN